MADQNTSNKRQRWWAKPLRWTGIGLGIASNLITLLGWSDEYDLLRTRAGGAIADWANAVTGVGAGPVLLSAFWVSSIVTVWWLARNWERVWEALIAVWEALIAFPVELWYAWTFVRVVAIGKVSAYCSVDCVDEENVIYEDQPIRKLKLPKGRLYSIPFHAIKPGDFLHIEVPAIYDLEFPAGGLSSRLKWKALVLDGWCKYTAELDPGRLPVGWLSSASIDVTVGTAVGFRRFGHDGGWGAIREELQLGPITFLKISAVIGESIADVPADDLKAFPVNSEHYLEPFSPSPEGDEQRTRRFQCREEATLPDAPWLV